MADPQLLAQIDSFVEDNREDIIRDIGKIIAVESTEGAPAPGAPFGPGARKALDVMLQMAEGMGFATNDGGGHVGWAELPGAEKGHLATITHVDVVPDGDGWTGDARTLRQQDGWLLGRGVGDDKGPGVLCLYAAKFLKEHKAPLRYGLRVLFGCNEESGMGDLPEYFKHNEEPLFCFSPDSDFPVCNGEKGVYSGAFSSKPLAGNLREFSGGMASNAVPSSATCLVAGDAAALQSTSRVTVSGENGLVRLVAAGVGGHAAMPEGTVNAIGLLVEYLLDNGLATGEEERFLQLLRALHRDTAGKGLGVDSEDPKKAFTPLTCVGGLISFKDGVLRQDINIRYPTSTTADAISAALQKAAEAHGALFEAGFVSPPFFLDADTNPAVACLTECHAQITGQNLPPFTIGGGTYARHFKNAVSFGPRLQGEVLPAFAGPEHAADEGLSIHTLMTALKVYILSLVELQKVDF